jgi:ornithine carbamoyltransferase
MRHFLSIADFSAAELWQLLSKAKELKDEFKQKGSNQPLLKRYWLYY